MKRMLLYPALVLIALAGCGGYQDKESGDVPAQALGDNAAPPQEAPKTGGSAPPSPAADTAGRSAPGAPAERKLIRNGQMEIRVESVDSAEAALARIAGANSGYIANSGRSRFSGNALRATAQLRFPSSRFDAVLASARALGKVESESVSTADVTAEYIDLTARLSTQKELETRLLELLEKRGAALADIIEIESKLAQVRNEIETMQGRLRYLEHQVAYSTLEISLMEPGTLGTNSTETFGGKIAEAFSDGWQGLVEVMAGLITVLMALLPVGALFAILYFLLFRPWSRRRRERRAAATPPVKPGGTTGA